MAVLPMKFFLQEVQMKSNIMKEAGVYLRARKRLAELKRVQNILEARSQNYPQGKMTSVETIPPYRYLTEEKITEPKWTLLAEHDTICGRSCQKATGEYGGRKWTVWFAESLPTRFGPWRLSGLPGLIMRAVSEDGIHQFECRKVEAVKEAITYSVPDDAVRCKRDQFVKLRNRTFGNANYLSNPTYYIKPAEIESMTIMDGAVLLGSVPIDMKPAKFQPLDY